MKTHLLRNIFIVGASALALAASAIVLPSVADAKGPAGHAMYTHSGHPGGRVAGNFRGHGGPRYGGRYGGGYYGGDYYGGDYCPLPWLLINGTCGPYYGW
jgi:hypothetical protein